MQSGALKENNRTHIWQWPFKCDVCKKYLKHSGNLKLQLRTHTGEKPFTNLTIIQVPWGYFCIHTLGSCHVVVCKKSFNHSSSLKLHQWTHIGERPITCDICKKSFKTSITLKLHLCTHIGEWLFTCNICGNLSKSQILWRCIYAIIQGRRAVYMWCMKQIFKSAW